MARRGHGKAFAGARSAGPGLRLALITGGTQQLSVAALLEEQGVEFDRFENPGDCPGGESAAVSLLCTDRSLSAAATEAAETLTGLTPSRPLVIVCAEVRPGELRSALAAGVAGVLLEAEIGAALGPCLAAVLAGQVCVPAELFRQIEPETLSGREKQILGLVVMGFMNSQIAEALFVAESTVKSHLSSAFGKLGVHSRNEAVELILDPERGRGLGVLGIGDVPVETVTWGEQ